MNPNQLVFLKSAGRQQFETVMLFKEQYYKAENI